MRQYRITTENVAYSDPTDCILADDDPFHELKIAHHLGGLGSDQRLAEYRTKQLPSINVPSAEEQRYVKSLRPGTDEWFSFYNSRRSSNATK